MIPLYVMARKAVLMARNAVGFMPEAYRSPNPQARRLSYEIHPLQTLKQP